MSNVPLRKALQSPCSFHDHKLERQSQLKRFSWHKIMLQKGFTTADRPVEVSHSPSLCSEQLVISREDGERTCQTEAMMVDIA